MTPADLLFLAERWFLAGAVTLALVWLALALAGAWDES